MADAVLYSSLDIEGLGTFTQSYSQNAVWWWHSLLKACLVDGYGSGVNRKEGQGWLMVDEDLPKGFTLKAPDGVYYVWCIGPNQTYEYTSMCQMWMAETLTEPYTYPPTGLNVRSGPHTNDNPSTNRSYIQGVYIHYPHESWFILARGSQFIFHSNTRSYGISAGGTSPSTDNTGYGDSTIFFGNAVLRNPLSPKNGPQNSMVIGCSASLPNTQNLSSETYGNFLRLGVSGAADPANIRLRDFVTGTVDIGVLPVFYGQPSKHTSETGFKGSMAQYPPDLVIERADLWQNGVGSLGYIPGTFWARSLNLVRFTQLMVAFGRSGVLADALEPVVIDGDEFLFLPSFFGTATFSLQEKYWV